MDPHSNAFAPEFTFKTYPADPKEFNPVPPSCGLKGFVRSNVGITTVPVNVGLDFVA